METAIPQQRSPAASDGARNPLILAAASLTLFHLAWSFQGDERSFWLPGLGLGIAMVSWLGWRILPVLLVDLIVIRYWQSSDNNLGVVSGDALLYTAQMGTSWWLFYRALKGSRWLDDPRSATLFLIFLPVALSAIFAMAQVFLWQLLHPPGVDLPDLVTYLILAWLSRMVGILVVVPLLLVVVTPLLLRWRLILVELPTSYFGEASAIRRSGEWIELSGLTMATAILALLLLWVHVHSDVVNWTLWGCCLILIVWTCVRQGLLGGAFNAGLTSMAVLMMAQLQDDPLGANVQSATQGNLLAFCVTALLVGVSSSWVRTTEARYRHVVGRIPVVLYSARLPYGIPALSDKKQPSRDSKRDMNLGPTISKMASIMLVSPASKQIMGCESEALLGPFSRWLDQIVVDDHELVVAALAQLCLQKQPVTCEYRVCVAEPPAQVDPALRGLLPRSHNVQRYRWVRDTLTPHSTEDGMVDGWEGLVEEITEQRALSQNLRKITNMLQVLITNLPTGVFFIQAPTGYPILVNARARQLLGQREDMSAGLAHLSRIYRLHRPDGTEYPWEELPISKALRLGTACRANDIVVHRSDGRKIPLIAWAAPIDLNNTGVPDAAVWVLEDWSAMQQAETALRESEVRLRAVIETMGEGVIVQDKGGIIVECNPAACAILQTPRGEMLNRVGLAPENGFLGENGLPLPRPDHPDQRALRDNQPVRGAVLGMQTISIADDGALGAVRWLLVNTLPLPVGPSVGLNYLRARVVTTFADITENLRFQESLRQAMEKYQTLVETLPFMMIQQDREGNITYHNPAAVQLTGYTSDRLMAPGFFASITPPEDWPIFQAAAELIAVGKSTRIELHLLAQDGSTKSVLIFIYPNVHDDNVVGSTSLVIDMTPQRRLEEELVRTKHLELVGKLASGTVHDFNNLLAVMISLAELAKMEVAQDHGVIPYLTRLIDVGEQASHLAGQILAFGKQRSNVQGAVELNLIVSQTTRMLQTVIPNNIKVETLLMPDLPAISGNDHQLKQILMNLCLNARDAMPDGGTLTIRTDLATPPESVVLANHQTWVHLSIQDTGQGMDEATRLRLFEPFFSTKERGTGLGLAVVQQIINDFGGHIVVKSTPGAGTTMDVWLARA